MDQALELANGKVVTVAGEEVTIDTAGAETYELPMNPLQSFLHLLSDPNIAFILFTIGFYGLLYEVISPNFVTGIVGAIAIVLAFIGFGSLPLNVAGLLLIALGVVMFVLEFHVISHGLLTVGGNRVLRAGRLCALHGARHANRARHPGRSTADLRAHRAHRRVHGVHPVHRRALATASAAGRPGRDRARPRGRCDRLGSLDARADGRRLCGRRGMDGAHERRAPARPGNPGPRRAGRMASHSSSSPSKPPG